MVLGVSCQTSKWRGLGAARLCGMPLAPTFYDVCAVRNAARLLLLTLALQGCPGTGGIPALQSCPVGPCPWCAGWGSRGFWHSLGVVVQEAGAAAQPQCCPVGCWRTKPLRVVEVVPGPWAHPVPRVRHNVVISQTKGEHLTGVALRAGLRQRRWLRFTGGPQGVILLVAELCFSCPAVRPTLPAGASIIPFPREVSPAPAGMDGVLNTARPPRAAAEEVRGWGKPTAPCAAALVLPRLSAPGTFALQCGQGVVRAAELLPLSAALKSWCAVRGCCSLPFCRLEVLRPRGSPPSFWGSSQGRFFSTVTFISLQVPCSPQLLSLHPHPPAPSAGQMKLSAAPAGRSSAGRC